MDEFNQAEKEKILYFVDHFGELEDWCQIHRRNPEKYKRIRAKVREILGLDPNEPLGSASWSKPQSKPPATTQSKPPAYQEPEESDDDEEIKLAKALSLSMVGHQEPSRPISPGLQGMTRKEISQQESEDAYFQAQLEEAFRLSMVGHEDPSSRPSMSPGLQGMTTDETSQPPATIADEPYGSSSAGKIKTQRVKQTDVYSIQLARKRKDKPDTSAKSKQQQQQSVEGLPGQPDFWWGQLHHELPAASPYPIGIAHQLSVALQSMLQAIHLMNQSLNQVVPGMSVQDINHLSGEFISFISNEAGQAIDQLFQPMQEMLMELREFEVGRHFYRQVLPQLETSLEALQSGFQATRSPDQLAAYNSLKKTVEEIENRILKTIQMINDVMKL